MRTSQLIDSFLGVSVQPRRTKLICSINENSDNIELLRRMVTSGADAFSLNIAYIRSRDDINKVLLLRNILEIEFQKTIPINLVLRGSIVRVGMFTEPEIYLQKGKHIYLTQDSEYLGNQQMVSIQNYDFFNHLSQDDQLGLDYGQILLKVEEIRDVESVYSQLNIPFNQEKKHYKVAVCLVQNDGLLRQFKPVFIIQQPQQEQEEKKQIEFKAEQTFTAQDEDDLEFIKGFDYDSITLSNTAHHHEITRARQMLKPNRTILVFARIAQKVSIEETEKIVRESDGIIIARSYISMTTAAEDLVKYQNFIINTARKMIKPVFISTQVVESMIVQSRPTFAEMGDISNVVQQYIDGIILSGETSFGKHPIEVIETLDRVCKNIERKQLQEQYLPQNKEVSQINFSGKPIASVIALCAVEMAFSLKASAIILMTGVLSSAVKISKLRSPCQIIALTKSNNLGRSMQLLNGVSSIIVEDQFDSTLEKTLNKCRDNRTLNEGQYVIVISGQDWNIDHMKVIKM
ncbi:hypothetical protein pb186bvf_006628 [Paramecium bursaria]